MNKSTEVVFSNMYFEVCFSIMLRFFSILLKYSIAYMMTSGPILLAISKNVFFIVAQLIVNW